MTNVCYSFENCINDAEYVDYLHNIIYPDGFGAIYLYAIFRKYDTLFYVGQSLKLLDRPYSLRRRHQRHIRGNLAVDRFLRNHKYMLFVLELVPESEIDEKETYYIDLYDSLNSGLNFTEGGCGCGVGENHPGYNIVPSQDKIDKIRQKAKENKNYITCPMSETTKDKIGKSNGRRIAQYTIDGILVRSYNSASEAGRSLGIRPSNIISAASHRDGRKKSHGYIWVWLDEPKVDKKRVLIQIDLDGNIVGRYSGPLDAECKTGINQSTICNALKGKQKTSGRFYWKYVLE